MKYKKFSRKSLVFFYSLKRKLKTAVKFVLFSFFFIIFILSIFKERHMMCFFKNVKNLYKKQLYNINYNICNRLVINGTKYSNLNEIQELVEEYCKGQDITIENLRNEILKNPWIKDIYIQKKFPNSLIVNVLEYNPFAITIDENNNHKLVDEFGDNINISKEEIRRFSFLFTIVGDNDKDEINNLFNLLSIYYNIARRITRVKRVGNRRWDLILDNKIVVKMPEEGDDVAEIWSILDKTLNMYGFDLDLKEIDLRLKDKIFLKYDDEVAEEIIDKY